MGFSKFELQLPIKSGDSIKIIQPKDLLTYTSEYFYKEVNNDQSFKCTTNEDKKKNSKIIGETFKNSYWKRQKYYYKVRCYLQDNKGNDVGIITFSKISVTYNSQ